MTVMHLLEAEPPPSYLRRHLFEYSDVIQTHLTRLLVPMAYRQASNGINIESVTTCHDSRPMKAVLEELQLPRQTRVTVAQFRSGYCSRLNSYLVCEGFPQDTPTTSSPAHLNLLRPTAPFLWPNTVVTAHFLSLPLVELTIMFDGIADLGGV